MASELFKLINNIYMSFDNIREFTYDKLYKNRQIIHVVGNGWGSYYFSKNIDKTKYKILTIAPNKNVLDTPKLVKLISDQTTKYEFNNPYTHYYSGKVINFDQEKKELYTDHAKFKYENVVFAIGSEPNNFNIEGVDKYANYFKQINDVHKLKQKLNNINKICIIGTGPTGIELSSILKKQYNKDVYLIEGMNTILPGFNDITKKSIHQYLKDSDIYLNTNNLVKKVTKTGIHTAINPAGNNVFNYDLIIWTGGVRFNGYKSTALFDRLNKIKMITPRGIETNNDFSIGNEKNIYCIGDMVSNKGPPTAQNAKQHGIWLANYFNNNKQITQEYEYKEQGKLIHLNNKTYLESKYYNDYIPIIINIFI